MSTVEKATDVLFFLSAKGVACGVSAIAQGVGVPKTSAHRLLQSLKHRELVEGDEAGRYRLGSGLVSLGLRATAEDRVVTAARGPMREHATEIGETFFLVAARAGELVVVEKAEGSGFLRASPRVGSTVPLHATAAGRLFLAFAPESFPGVPEPEYFTRYTPVMAPELARLVQQCRDEGYALSRDEWLEGLSAIAAPVIASGKLLGAIAVACASPRLDEIGVPRLVNAAVTAARAVSLGLLEGVSG
jgi:IclR family acetate operon transcriptional repressor